jgi:hypothetical protein
MTGIKPLPLTENRKYDKRGIIGRHDRYISRWNKIKLNSIVQENKHIRKRRVQALQHLLQRYYRSNTQ